MPNPHGAPEISVQDVSEKQKNGNSFVWLDVREPHEIPMASISDESIHLVPLSTIAQQQLEALPEVAKDPHAEIIVFCHHGGRSAQVVMWLQQQGWTNVLNMDGGIHAWAEEIDSSIGTY